MAHNRLEHTFSAVMPALSFVAAVIFLALAIYLAALAGQSIAIVVHWMAEHWFGVGGAAGLSF